VRSLIRADNSLIGLWSPQAGGRSDVGQAQSLASVSSPAGVGKAETSFADSLKKSLKAGKLHWIADRRRPGRSPARNIAARRARFGALRRFERK